ncbi:MAG: TolC family outer membrane protein [Hyphomicrobiales bacterium]|nr:TolC family outer membrane protein [Hyphomicrobiales bacterium]
MSRYAAAAPSWAFSISVWRAFFVLALVIGVSLAVTVPAAAETLEQALVHAYTSNPDLNAQRASLRATDEGVAEARAGYRPSLLATGDLGVNNVQTDSRGLGIRPTTKGPTSDGTTHPKGYAFTLNQPLYRGGRTINAVREAEANVRAGRENLRSVEQGVLLNAVIAYMDVVRDQAIVRLQENNVKVLTEQLTATKDRFEVGEVTKTDVAQAEARRSGSISELSAAQADLKSSRAVYEQIIGHPPSNLSDPPPIETVLPRSLPEALQIGAAEDPDILAALKLEEAARYVVKQLIGETLPEIDVEARFEDRFETSFITDAQEATTVTGRLTVPLYSGGAPSARVRGARNVQDQRRREIDSARLESRAQMVAAWSRLVAARAQVESDQAQVRANRIALNGVREEEKVGQRTILDVLDAEQEYLDSQVSLVGTKRDLVVASFALYAAIGRLDARSLGLPVAYYDPEEHYNRVRRKLFGFRP